MSTPRWLVYGVGATGTLIVEEAVRRGHTPLLAGRSAERLKPLAERFGLARVVADVDVVVHTAGPFVATHDPMLRACLAHTTHYLDISNEIPVFQSVRARDTAARQQGIVLMPGI